MKVRCVIAACVFLSCIFAAALVGQSSSPPPAISEQTFRSGTSLVLLDVFALDSTTGLPLNKLTREDFRVLDGGRPVAIETFDSGVRYDTRPFTLWLVTLCNMLDYSELQSGLFAGKINLFRPALEHLDKHDTVGVAHWCDNGESGIDLQPNRHIDQVIAATEKSLQKRPFNNPRCEPMLGNRAVTCAGERALREMMQKILQNTSESKRSASR